MQKELNSYVARFATHIKLVLQQISLLLVAKSCCRKYRSVLLIAKKSVHFTHFTSPRQMSWQKVKKRPSIAWLPRNFNQSEVSIHATSKNLICCKTGFNVGGKTRNISFQLVAKQVTRSLGPRLSLSTKYMASTWMLLKDFHHTIIPVAVIKKRNFSLKTKSVFELSFTSLSPGAPNDNFRKNVCSEDDLRSRIFGTFVVKFLACPLLGISNI